MVSRVKSLVGNHSLATSSVVGAFVNSRHRNLLESYDWSRRKQDVIITSAVDKIAGRITVANGSSNVTGSGTSFAQSDVGRSLKIGSNSDSIWNIKSVGGAAALVLGDANGSTVAYPGANASSQTYLIFTQYYNLGTGIEQIIDVKYKTSLTEVSEEFLNELDPSRTATGDPMYFARGSRNMSGNNDIVRIELYPRLETAVAINVKIEKGHTDLTGTQNPIVPSGPVEWFAAVDTCFYLKAKTKDDSWMTLAQAFSTNGEQSREFELSQDSRKFGVQQTVRDVVGGVGLGMTDYGLDRDTGF